VKRIALALVIVLVACGGSKTFRSEQLGSILPQQSDAPAGLQYINDGSGPQTVDQISKDDSESAQLKSFGFQSAYAAFFANAGAIQILAQQSLQGDPASRLVAALGVVFKTPDGAKKALALEHQSDLKSGTNIKTVTSEKIGDETIAESGTQENIPFPGYLLYWREGNALFAILVAGGPTAGVTLNEATALARTMHSRAQKA
jgi:hypothetical protein